MARWEVRSFLAFEVHEPATIVLAVAPAQVPGRVVHERFSGATPVALEDRLHVLLAEPGPLQVDYSATVEGGDVPAAGPVPFDRDAVAALRPSRYCPNDELGGFAAATFGTRPPSSELAHEVADWVHGRVVLLGDAAAGFLPTAGVGASMAMESAAVLADELSRTDRRFLEHALSLYVKRRKRRVEGIQDDSRKLARLMFVQSAPVTAIRNYVSRYMTLEMALASITKAFDEPI